MLVGVGAGGGAGFGFGAGDGAGLCTTGVVFPIGFDGGGSAVEVVVAVEGGVTVVDVGAASGADEPAVVSDVVDVGGSTNGVAVVVAGAVAATGGSVRRELVVEDGLLSFTIAVTIKIAPMTPAATDTPSAAAAKYLRRLGPSSTTGCSGKYSMFAEPRVAELVALGVSLRLIGPLAALGADGASLCTSAPALRALGGACIGNCPVDAGPIG